MTHFDKQQQQHHDVLSAYCLALTQNNLTNAQILYRLTNCRAKVAFKRISAQTATQFIPWWQNIATRTHKEIFEGTLLNKETAYWGLLEHCVSERLLAFCIHLCLGDTHAAQDLHQNTVLRAHKNIGKFDFKKCLFPWMCTIAKRVHIDTFRKNKRQNKSLPPDIETQVQTQDEQGRHLDNMTDIELAWCFSDPTYYALAQLSVTERCVILMFYIYNVPQNEIAEVLNMKLNTVKSHIKRGKEQLKNHLGQRPSSSPFG
jgi:RNA polymerase sigma-70 factor (ECF subfamily)